MLLLRASDGYTFFLTMQGLQDNPALLLAPQAGKPGSSSYDIVGPQGEVTLPIEDVIADDGYEAEASLEELRACEKCIVAFRTQGGFSTVLPGLLNNTLVKGVILIRVK
jgi:hypothetical protein